MKQEMFNPLEHPVCLDYPGWIDATAWAEHVPFAMFLVSAARPRTIVELGAYRGVSYCAFCQAVKALELSTKCHAVDTWQGDPHAGNIDETVLGRLRLHHDPLYGDFSTLIPSTFGEALVHFSDATIDLLHIDGFHTYQAVKDDFESWLPKLSDRGIVLFHDTNVRRDDFGVWRFWEEVRSLHRSFEFVHGHGLGILAVGNEIPAGVQFLFSANEEQTNLIRKFFSGLGARIEAVRTRGEQLGYIEDLKTYEKIVNGSRILRLYRVLKSEGLPGAIKRARR
jgi:hypothetical protein